MSPGGLFRSSPGSDCRNCSTRDAASDQGMNVFDVGIGVWTRACAFHPGPPRPYTENTMIAAPASRAGGRRNQRVMWKGRTVAPRKRRDGIDRAKERYRASGSGLTWNLTRMGMAVE